MNITALIGRLTFEPELKATASGISVLRLQIAVNRKYASNGEERKADFIDCIAWRNTAEFINRYFHKGDMIAVEGEIQTNNYTDKDGIKRKAVEIVVNQVSFCGSKGNGTQGDADPNLSITKEESQYPANGFEEIGDEDDLPF